MRASLVLLAVACAAAPLAAQDAAAQAALPATRANWYSDRLPLRVGDILTIVVDEETAARERVSTTATANRDLNTQLGLNVDSAVRVGPSKAFGSGLNSSSRDVGDAVRQGNLTAVLSVRVVSLDAAGHAHIEGGKTVTVDGRTQEVRVKGIVRPEDVSASNAVLSSRIADAEISYKGKKIGPRKGILGGILSILWP